MEVLLTCLLHKGPCEANKELYAYLIEVHHHLYHHGSSSLEQILEVTALDHGQWMSS